MATLTLKANGSTVYDTSIWLNTEQAYDDSTSTYASQNNSLSSSNISNAPIGFSFDTSAIPTGSIVSSITINITVKQNSSNNNNRLTIEIQDSGKNTLGTTTKLSNTTSTTLTRTVTSLDQMSCVWVVPTIGTGSNYLYIYDVSATIEYEERYLIASYDYDKTIHSSIIPSFNSGFTYTTSDVTNGNIITRSIYSATKPTYIYFGDEDADGDPTAYSRALTKVHFLEVSNLEHAKWLFYNCTNLTEVNASNWDIFNVTDTSYMFYNCAALRSLKLPNSNDNSTEAYYTDINLPITDIITFKNNNQASWTNNNTNVYDGDTESYISLTIATSDADYGTKAYINVDKNIIPDNAIITKATISYIAARTYSLLDAVNVRIYIDDNNYIDQTKLDQSVSGLKKIEVTKDITNYASELLNGNVHIAVSSPSSTSIGFYLYEIVLTIDYSVEVLNANNIENMSWMFADCSSLESLDLSNWDVSNATNMNGMFYGCYSLTSLNLSNWVVGNATDMFGMFGNCESLTSLDLSKWSVGNVTNIAWMFSDCYSLTSLDLSNWVVSNVTDMNGMFCNCYSLTTIRGLSKWDVGNVTDMSWMFENCESLVELDLTNWDVSNVTNMTGMFAWDGSYSNCGCYSLTSIGDLSNWDVGNVTSMDWMFNCQSLTTIGDLSDWQVGNVENMSGMFGYCYSLTTVGDLSNWDVSNVTDMYGMFEHCRKITSLDIANWNTGKVTNMENMFYGCHELSSLNVSNWNTNSVTGSGFNKIFADCHSLRSLDLTNWDTSNITDFTWLFTRCYYLTSIGNINNWNTNNVNCFDSMFFECESLVELDLSNWNTSNVTDMGWIFYGCTSLNKLNISNWDTSNVTYIDGIFSESAINEITMNDSDYNSVNKIIAQLPIRTATEPGMLDVIGVDDASLVDKITAESKYWDIISEDSKILIAQYKFDKSIYGNNSSTLYDLNQPTVFDGTTCINTNIQLIKEDIDWTIMVDFVPTVYGGPQCIFHCVEENTNVGYPGIALTCEAGFVNFYYGESGTSLMLTDDRYENQNIRLAIVKQGSQITIYRNDNDIYIVDNPAMIPYTFRSAQAYLRIGNMGENSSRQFYGTINNFTIYNGSFNAEQCKAFIDSGKTGLIPIFNDGFNDYIVVDNEPEIVDFRSRLAFGHTDDAGIYYKPMYLDNGDIEFSCHPWDVCRIDISEHLGKLITVSFNYANKPGWCELAVCMGDFNDTIIAEWREESGAVNSNYTLPIQTSATNGISEISIEGMYVWLWNISIMTEDGIELFPMNMKEEYSQSAVKNYHTPDLVYDNELNFSNIWNAMYIDINDYIGKEIHLTFDILGLPNDNGWTEFEYSQFDGAEWHRVDGSMYHIIYDDISEVTNVHCDSTMIVAYDYLYIGGMGGRISNLKIEVKNPSTENIIVRSIYANELPTLMRFGAAGSSNSRSQSLLEVNYVNTDNLDTMYCMFDECNNLRAINTENFNTNNVTDMSNMFYNCSSLESLDLSNWNVSNVIDMYAMFHSCHSLTSLDLTNWDTSNVDDMAWMFFYCYELTTIGDLSNWNVNNVANMACMFAYCQSLTSLDLSDWQVGNVIDMSWMFSDCHSLVAVGDLSNWQTGNVENMARMFGYCYSLTTTGDLSDWNVSNVTDMCFMFYGCYLLTSVGDLFNWQVGNVENTEYMFCDCELLSSLNLSNWNVSNVTDMEYMFCICKSLTTVGDLSNWDTSNVTNMEAMFRGCYSLTNLNLSSFNTNKLDNMEMMFRDCNNLTSLDLSNFDTSNTTDMDCLFYSCDSLIDINISNWDLNNITDFAEVFYETPYLRSITMHDSDYNSVNKIIAQLPIRTEAEPGILNIENVDDFFQVDSETAKNKYWNILANNAFDLMIQYKFDNTINGNLLPTFNEDFRYSIEDSLDGNIVTRSIYSEEPFTSITFTGQTSLLEVNYIDTSELISTCDLFYNCTNLTYVNFIGSDFSKVETVERMFAVCKNLIKIDGLNDIDVSNVNNMGGLFTDCDNIPELDVKDWDVSKVTNFGAVFRRCYKLNKIDVSKWNTSNGSIMSGIFTNCTSLKEIDIYNWDTTNATTVSQMFYGCTSLTLVKSFNHISTNTVTTYLFGKCTSLNHVQLPDSDVYTINKVIEELPTRTATSPGVLDILGADIIDQVNVSAARNKYWEVIAIHNAVKNVYIGNTQINTLFLQKDKKIKGIYFGDNKLY